jgi:uncharacterized protein YprB with RNaseH-like and TPR domain
MEMFLDIETTNIRADIGQIIAIGVIKDNKKEVKFVNNPEEEKIVLEWLRDELKDCTLIVTWFGSNFDLPFIITRAIINNIDLHNLLEIPSLDLCDFVRKNLCLSKNSLQEVSKSLGILKDSEASGRDMLKFYIRAIKGDKKAKEMITKHCLDDLESMKKIFEKLKPYLNFVTKNP